MFTVCSGGTILAPYLGGCGPELLEQVREEGCIVLQLGQDLQVIEQHHTLQRCKGLVI